jgi:CHAD domain-containing protein
MPVAADAVCGQPRKLRKAIEKIRKDSSPDVVHKLRTRLRRMEAMVAALALDSRKNERLLLRALKPLRCKAGRVRDMDVLTEFASRPHVHDEEKRSIQLLEHLGAEREWRAGKLENRARTEYPEIRRRLKKCAAFLDKTLQNDGKSHAKASSRSRQWEAQASALALQLESELRDWPALNRGNLHLFRLKVKKLRYVLQLAERNDNKFVSALGEVKNAIGEWHDWQDLSELAKEVIHHPGRRLRQAIDRIARERFESAVASANRLRRKYLYGQGQKYPARPGPNLAITSASALAA